MHLIVGGCSGRPIKCGLILLARVKSPNPLLMVGIRSISTSYEVPHAQGVISCKAWQAVENSLSVAQRIRKAEANLECGSGRHCNERTADDVLISLPQGRHNTHPMGALRTLSYTCMAHVKQVRQRPILAWYLCHLCTRLAVVRLPQTSN